MAFAIAAFQGKIYCIGGYHSANEVYDPNTNSWETKASMPVIKGWIYAKVVDDKIFILDLFPKNYTGLYDVYDPVADTWNSSVPSPPDGKLLLDYHPSGYETTGVNSPKMIYSFSGYHAVATAYNPQNHTWLNGSESPIGRAGTGIALANDIFYVVGGYTYEPWGPFAPVANNEEYFPISYGTPDPTYALEHFPPQITFQSPQNQTYNNSTVPITFTVNKNITMTSYSLDGAQNITFAGNATISNIPSGYHNITIYANDTYGNIGSQTVTFTIEQPQNGVLGNSYSFAIIAVAVVVICVVAGSLFYRRYHKKID
jgi:hypothetical protein